jgi:hypothetical protein
MPKLDVQHWLRTAFIRQVGPRHVFNLHEAGVEFEVPASLEFPRIIPRWDMYLRVGTSDSVQAGLRIRIHHQRRSNRWVLMNDYHTGVQYLVLAPRGFEFHDRVLPLAHVRLEGPGFYSISLFFRYDGEVESQFEPAEETPWNPDEPEWKFAAVEYVRVAR